MRGGLGDVQAANGPDGMPLKDVVALLPEDHPAVLWLDLGMNENTYFQYERATVSPRAGEPSSN